MNKQRSSEAGFSTVELVLIIVIVALIGVVGWMVYKNHHKTTVLSATKVSTSNKPASTLSTSTVKTTTPAKTVSPYTGWLSYTTKYEGLTFKYPSNWTIRDESGPLANGDDADAVQVIPPDGSWQKGFDMEFFELQSNTGPQTNEDTIVSTTPVTFLGQSDYIIYYSAGATPSDSSQTALSTSYVSTSSTQIDAPAIPWDSSKGWQVTLLGPYNSSNDSPSNPDFATAKLIVESAAH